jgi:hypothetical protein
LRPRNPGPALGLTDRCRARGDISEGGKIRLGGAQDRGDIQTRQGRNRG